MFRNVIFLFILGFNHAYTYNFPVLMGAKVQYQNKSLVQVKISKTAHNYNFKWNFRKKIYQGNVAHQIWPKISMTPSYNITTYDEACNAFLENYYGIFTSKGYNWPCPSKKNIISKGQYEFKSKMQNQTKETKPDLVYVFYLREGNRLLLRMYFLLKTDVTNTKRTRKFKSKNLRNNNSQKTMVKKFVKNIMNLMGHT